jgi:SAM-dependent methyltransferase
MRTLRIDRQYSTGLSRHNIEQALTATGKDLKHLQPADLGVLEDFHTLGRSATRQLAELAEINSCDKVLDAGSGIGGTAHFLADRYRCSVTAIDLTKELRNSPLAQPTRRPGRPDLRTPRRRHRSALRPGRLHRGHEPARPDERA